MASASNIRAGGAYVELFTKDGKLVGGLNRAAAKLKAFGASVSAVGQRMATMGVMFAVPLLASAKVFADMGSDMLDMSQRVGIGVEALSELRYAIEQSGGSAEDLENAFKFMQKGNFGQSTEDFLRLADEIANTRGEAAKTQRVIEVFGRAGTRLKPLFAEGARGIRELMEEARRLGITMSREDAVAAESFGDTLSTLGAVVKKVFFNIGGALAPSLKELAVQITNTSAIVADWIKRNIAVIKIVGLLVAGLTAAGIALMLLGPALKVVALGITFVAFAVKAFIAVILIAKALLLSLATPLGLILLALDALRGYMLMTAVQSTGTFTTLQQGFRDVAATAVQAWGGIADAIAAGDWMLAAQIGWTGIKLMFEQGVAALEKVWDDFAAFFVDVWHEAATTIATVIENITRLFKMNARDWRAVLAEMSITNNPIYQGTIGSVASVFGVQGLNVPSQNQAALAQAGQLEQERNTISNQLDAAIRSYMQQTGSTRAQAMTATPEIRALRDQFDRLGAQIQQALGNVATPTPGSQITASQVAADAQRERDRQRAAANAARDAAAAADVARLQQELDVLLLNAAEARSMAEGAARGRGVETDLGDMSKKAEAKGTFSAFAIGGLGASSVVDKMARSLENIDRNTRSNAEPAFT